VILTKINSNLDQVDRSQILEGKLSSLIELPGLHEPMETTAYGKIKFVNDGEGPSTKLFPLLTTKEDREKQFAIYNISDLEKATLNDRSNSYVVKTNSKGISVLYKLDHETGNIIPSLPKELNIPIKIGNTKLTNAQIQEMANTGQINDFKISHNGKLKTGTIMVVDGVIGLRVEKAKRQAKEQSKSTQYLQDSKAIKKHINAKSYSEIKATCKKQGFVPRGEFLKKNVLMNSKLKNDKEKLIVLSSLGVEPSEALKMLKAHRSQLESQIKQSTGKRPSITKGTKKMGARFQSGTNKMEGTISKLSSGM